MNSKISGSKKNEITAKIYNISIIEFLVFSCIITVTILGIYFANQMMKASSVKSLIMQIKKYDNAVAAFAEKYDALPGDVCNTQKYGITKNDSDGNCDNIISDAAQKIISANGEIGNFWLHLSASKMLDENFDGAINENAKIGSSFPISKIGNKIGIVAYGDEGKIFYQIGFEFSDHQRIFMSDKSLKTFESYWFDKKIDDGNPRKGRVIAVGNNSLNVKDNPQCVKFSKYDQSNSNLVCQLRIEIK